MMNLACFCQGKWWKRAGVCWLMLSLAGAAEDPRLEARKRAREAEVQRAGLLRALSREMASSVRELPIFGSIEWVVKELFFDFTEKGYSQHTIQGVTERLDLNRPERGWQRCAPIPGSPRGWCATSVVDGKLYLLGGVTWTATARQRLSEALCYDPTRDQWKRLADFPIPMSGWSGDVFDRRHLIVIGGAGTRWNDVPFVYDTRSDRWMRIASPLPPGALFNDTGVCIIGDTIFVAGGEGPGGSHFNHFLIGKIKALPVADPR